MAHNEYAHIHMPSFINTVAERGAECYRDLPWRRTTDPYAVLVSEIMLQQTQVSRVIPYFDRWMSAFPTLEALSSAPLEAVLREWQGLGYNRRAIALKAASTAVVDSQRANQAAALPEEECMLLALPGIGPVTAAGVRAFAFGKHGVYLDTNVRAVFLHELLADRDGVSDSVVRPLVAMAAAEAEAAGIGAREWNYALLDYGAHLKRTVPNPSRRSAHHGRQSPFEGSRRQRRARLLRAVMAFPGAGAHELSSELGLAPDEAEDLLQELGREGFLARDGEGGWSVA